MIPQIFNVLTEFRFETGSAIAASGALQGAVDKLSGAAESALITFQKMSLGIVSGFLNGPYGGIVGIISAAVNATSDYQKAQLALTNVLGKESGTFEERMHSSAMAMEKMNKLAQQFSLPSEDLVNIAKTITPVLGGKMPKPLALEKSMNLGRLFLKAAPTLGVDPSSSASMFNRMMMGMADQGDTLFRVLTSDTDAMRQFAGASQKWNQLPMAERVKLATKAFDQFANDAKILEATALSVNSQLRVLKQNLVGMFSIFRPLGDIFSRLISEVLFTVNKILSGPIKNIIANLSRGLNPLLKNAESVYATLTQLRNLKTDLISAGRIMAFSAAMWALHHILGLTRIRIPIVTAMLGKFHAALALLEGGALAGLVRLPGIIGVFLKRALFGALAIGAGTTTAIGGSLFAFIKFLPQILKVFNFFTIWISRVLGPLALITMLFQLISRSWAYVKIEAAQKLIALGEAMSQTGETFMRILAVFTDGFDKVSRFVAISPIIDFIFWIVGGINSAIEWIFTKIGQAMMAFQGIFLGFLELINQIKNLVNFGFKKFDLNKVSEAFEFGMEDMYKRIFEKVQTGDATALNYVEMHNQITFDIKEKIEPDRIAFTLTEQLKKLASNPTSGRNQQGAMGMLGRGD